MGFFGGKSTPGDASSLIASWQCFLVCRVGVVSSALLGGWEKYVK